jgi:CGNR zinc finger/Putative stress-induced transcription regulator
VSFGSHADRVVTLAVALVNELTPGEARGRPAPRLDPAGRRARARAVLGLPLTGAEAEELTRLAGRLRPVFAAVDGGDLDAAVREVNGLLDEYRPRPYLARHDGDGWQLHFHAPGAGAEAGWGAGCAVALAGILASESWRRLGICSALACDRVFVDVSRNGSRRFCSVACQNRTKASALRARRRAGRQPPES